MTQVSISNFPTLWAETRTGSPRREYSKEGACGSIDHRRSEFSRDAAACEPLNKRADGLKLRGITSLIPLSVGTVGLPMNAEGRGKTSAKACDLRKAAA